MKRLIIFLIRKKLGIKKYTQFRFTNQKTRDIYYFMDSELIKIEYSNRAKSFGKHRPSGVSLNWLLSDECKITTRI